MRFSNPIQRNIAMHVAGKVPSWRKVLGTLALDAFLIVFNFVLLTVVATLLQH